MRGERRRPTPHLGDQLHPRNRYKNSRPDFYELGQLYPSFLQFLRNVNAERKTASLPFDDPEAVRELTRTLLQHDFGLDWTMPLDRLCPPLPNRLNYLHWIEDLLLSNGIDPFTSADSTEIIRGIDIGTGASCIYALLGAKMNAWRFIATEIDAESYASAVANVSRNQLVQLVHVQRVTTSNLLREPLGIAPQAIDMHNLHFSMCNPPFFGDMSEADTNPDSACMGNASEMVFPGGEVAFIGHMIDDSLVLRDRVLLYTSMIGKKASLREVLAKLRASGINNMCSIEFFQGRTKRWGIAWSFSSRISLHKEAKVLGKRKEAHRQQQLAFTVPKWSSQDEHGCRKVEEVIDRIKEYTLSVEELVLEPQPSNGTFQLSCHERATDSNAGGSTVFEAIVQVTDESAEYSVTVAYTSGSREQCWRTAESVKAATIRSGRAWRRKRTNPN